VAKEDRMGNAIQFARGASLMLMLTSTPALAQTNHDLPPHNPVCTLTTFLEPWRGVPPQVYRELAPDDVLRIGVNYGNPNNASIDSTGTLQGVAVDLGCVLARRLGIEVEFVPYPGIPPMLQGFETGEWNLGFSFDPDLSPQNFSYAHVHLGVENTYLVPGTSKSWLAPFGTRPLRPSTD
jgi:ABC-type amino acid transport substrate-binding protein